MATHHLEPSVTVVSDYDIHPARGWPHIVVCTTCGTVHKCQYRCTAEAWADKHRLAPHPDLVVPLTIS